jgi:membrane fusion protein (multidrug efflux system)
MKHRVALIAIGALLAIAAIVYFARDALSPGPAAMAGVKGEAGPGAAKAEAGKGEVKADAKGGAAGKGPGGPGGPTPVEVVLLKPVVVKEDLQAVGSLRSNESAILRPEVSGRIAAINFKDGQMVRKGQVLVALDASLNEAEVAQARAEYDLAISNLRRSEDLARRSFISSSAQETAASNAQVAEARLKLAQARLSKMRIVAPFDGQVGIRNVSPGDYVKDGTDLVNIEDTRVLKVDFRLPERNFKQIAVGQSVEVVADALPGERWLGRIEAINPKVDANGRSLEIRAQLDNTAGRLKPGMFVRVRVIVGERANALMIPEEAIVPQGEEFYVFKVVDNAARRVPVKIGVRRDAMVEVLQGLAAGDQVVTAGMRLSRDGQPVRVLNAGAPAAPKPDAPAKADTPAKGGTT